MLVYEIDNDIHSLYIFHLSSFSVFISNGSGFWQRCVTVEHRVCGFLSRGSGSGHVLVIGFGFNDTGTIRIDRCKAQSTCQMRQSHVSS